MWIDKIEVPKICPLIKNKSFQISYFFFQPTTILTKASMVYVIDFDYCKSLKSQKPKRVLAKVDHGASLTVWHMLTQPHAFSQP